MGCAAFSTLQMASCFRDFGKWLGGRIGPHYAAVRLNRHLDFFLRIEGEWLRIPEYGKLLARFGAEGLRCARLPMQWMAEAGHVAVDAAAREANSETRRIDALCAGTGDGTPERAIIDGYRKALEASMADGKTTLRSIRLALSPTAALLLAGRGIGQVPPGQAALDAYLAKSPGQRAAVSGFTCHLRDAHKELFPIQK